MCQVVGARPAPAVTWWKGTQQIRDNITTNVSFSLASQGLQSLATIVCKSKSKSFPSYPYDLISLPPLAKNTNFYLMFLRII